LVSSSGELTFADCPFQETPSEIIAQFGIGRFSRSCASGKFFTEKKTAWTIETKVADVTKYSTDRPEGGWPEWIMQTAKRARRFSIPQGLDLLSGIVKTGDTRNS
jgi:hypothetical protein